MTKDGFQELATAFNQMAEEDKYTVQARTICTGIFRRHEQDHDFTYEQFRAEVEAATQSKAVRRICFWMWTEDAFKIDW